VGLYVQLEVTVINRLLYFVALVVVTGACSSSPQLPSAPSTVAGKLTVALSSKAGTPLSGTVTLFDQSDKVVGTHFVEAGSNAVFSNLAAGAYRVTGAPVFGWQPAESRISVENREEKVQLQLDMVLYDIRFLELLVNGQVHKGAEPVPVPATLTFRVEVANGTNQSVGAQVRIFGDPVGYRLGIGTSDAVQPGLQEVAITLKDFRPCSEAGECSDKSKLTFFYVGDYPFRGAHLHRIVEVPLSYLR